MHVPRIPAVIAALLCAACRSGSPAASGPVPAEPVDHAPASQAAPEAASGAAIDAGEVGGGVGAQDDAARMAWFREARFGLFVHWGLYAIPAGKWGEATQHGEWIRDTAQIPIEEYDGLLAQWNPVEFDADEWARMAAEAGMRYVVITSKHHDGFCLFDSAETDFDVMSTPFARDVLAELSAACRSHDLRIGWYHSILDWHHPDYLPRRGWEERSSEGADLDRYVEHLRRQVTELLGKYGPIGVMWFDGEWESSWTHERGQALYELCRELQPDVIVNNRVDKGRAGMAGLTLEGEFAGDYGTPEQEVPATGIPGVDWETCMTMNDHWGYCAADQNWKSTQELVHTLCDVASKGGNLLLNVGPMADGRFPAESVERLREIGAWMKVNGEAIHGTSASPFRSLAWGRCTERRTGDATRLYLHVFDWPAGGVLEVPGLGNEVLGASLLADTGAELAVDVQDARVSISVPADVPDPICSVVALDLRGAPIVYDAPAIEAAAEIFVRSLEVRLALPASVLEVRYTLDGTEPTPTSSLYRGPIAVTSTAELRARSFRDGRGVSPVAAARLEKVEPRPASPRAASLLPGLACARYAGEWERVPAFDELEPVERTVAADIALDASAPEERAGRVFSGYLEVPVDDAYVFALISDDGARLWIDGELVVDNDGLHGPEERRGRAPLAAGLHAIRVEYFNRTGGQALELRAAPLGAAPAAVVPSALWHRGEAE